MEQIVINKASGEKIYLFSYDAVSGVQQASQEWDLAGQDIVNISATSAIPLDFSIGDWLEVFGRLYRLNTLPEIHKINDRNFEYTIQFEGLQYDLIKVQYLDIDDLGNSTGTSFYVMADAELLIKLVIKNLERVYGVGKWKLGDFPIGTEVFNLQFQNQNCLAALQAICDTYQQSFVIERLSDGTYKLHLRVLDNVLPDIFKYGRIRGLYGLERSNSSTKNIVTRLFAYGASKNLPLNYRGGSERLKMPAQSVFSEAQPYIEDTGAIAKYGIIEASLILDTIFPNRTASVTSIDPGNPLVFYDTTMNFNLTESVNNQTTYLIDGQAAKIVFKTGKLAGYEFTLNSNTTGFGFVYAEKKFTINTYTDDSGFVFPSMTDTEFQIQTGDQYTIVDIAMPQSYINAAEEALEQEAGQYLYDNCKPRVKYTLNLDANYIASKAPSMDVIVNYFSVGDYVNVFDEDLGIDGRSQIQSLRRNILKHYEYDLTLADEEVNSNLRLYRTRRQRLLDSINGGGLLTTAQIAQVTNITGGVILRIPKSGLFTLGW